MTNRAASFLRLLGLAGATLLVSACGIFSPVQTDYSYIPADGVPLTLPGLEFRNLAIVTDGADAPGVVIGQAVNDGPQAVDVEFSVGTGATARAAIPAFSGDALSLTTPVVLEGVQAAPGSLVELTVTTAEAGRNVVSVPVLDRTRYYTQLPTPTSAATSASPGPSASPTPSPSGTATEG